MSKVSFIKSDDRKYNIERCLSLIKSEVISGIKNAKKVVIKPNCVTDNVKLAATNILALEAVLEFISPYVNCQITLAEGVSVGETLEAFKNFSYLSLHEKYDLTLVDLNKDEFTKISLLDKNGEETDVKVAKTILESDYLISISAPKTDRSTAFSGAIKNVAIGSLIRSNSGFSFGLGNLKKGSNQYDKTLSKQGIEIVNENIKRIYQKIPSGLAVLDGYEAMEGEGPVDGDLVPAHFAIASSDFLAADWLACKLESIDIEKVGYLSKFIQEESINPDDFFVIGDDWNRNVTKFKMPSN